MDEFIAFLSSWPVYEVVIFSAGMLAGYGVALWQRQQRKRERQKRNMQAHARKVAGGGHVGRRHHDESS